MRAGPGCTDVAEAFCRPAPLGLPADAAWAAVTKIYESIGVDMDGSLQLIHDSATVLAAAQSKMTRSA